ALEEKADGYGLAKTDRLPAMRVAARAWAAGLWVLADAAFKRAWAAGDVGAESVGLRYGILRNWGHQLAFGGNTQTRAQGVMLLATARAIGEAYNLPNGEACLDLQQLGYADCSQPAPDTSEPVLVAAKK